MLQITTLESKLYCLLNGKVSDVAILECNHFFLNKKNKWNFIYYITVGTVKIQLSIKIQYKEVKDEMSASRCKNYLFY